MRTYILKARSLLPTYAAMVSATRDNVTALEDAVKLANVMGVGRYSVYACCFTGSPYAYAADTSILCSKSSGF